MIGFIKAISFSVFKGFMCNMFCLKDRYLACCGARRTDVDLAATPTIRLVNRRQRASRKPVKLTPDVAFMDVCGRVRPPASNPLAQSLFHPGPGTEQLATPQSQAFVFQGSVQARWVKMM